MGFETTRSNGLLEGMSGNELSETLRVWLAVCGLEVVSRVAPELMPAGVRDLETGLLPSPSLTKVSTARSKSSLSPLSTISLRRSFVNPISCNTAILDSKDAVVTSTTGAPRPVVLLDGGGGGDQAPLSEVGDVTFGLLLPNRRRFDVEDDERRPNLKNLPDLGGRGGGDPSGDLS